MSLGLPPAMHIEYISAGKESEARCWFATALAAWRSGDQCPPGITGAGKQSEAISSCEQPGAMRCRQGTLARTASASRDGV